MRTWYRSFPAHLVVATSLCLAAAPVLFSGWEARGFPSEPQESSPAKRVKGRVQTRPGDPLEDVEVAVHERIWIGRERGLSTLLTNDSPLANTRERNWLVTVLRPEGLLFFVAVAPEGEFQNYNGAFETMLQSTQFAGTLSNRLTQGGLM